MEDITQNKVEKYERYSEKELKKSNFFQKSMVIGLTGLAIVSAFNVGYSAMNQNDALLQLSGSQKEQIAQVIEKTNEMGFRELYIPKNSPHRHGKERQEYFKEIQGKDIIELYTGYSHQTKINRSFDLQSCSIYLSVPDTDIIANQTIQLNDTNRIGEVDFSYQNYKDVTMSNGAEWDANNVFNVAIAIGKCDVGNNPALYQVFQNKEINDLFAKVEQKDYYNSSYNSTFGRKFVTDNAGSLLENSYSEGVAIILTARSDLASKDNFLDKRMVETLFNRNNVYSDLQKETVAQDLYAVHEYARTPEIQERINAVKTAEDVRVLATEMAHHNFKQVVASKSSEAFYTQERLNREAFDSFLNDPVSRGTYKTDTFWSNVSSEVANKFSREDIYGIEKAVLSIGKISQQNENTHSEIPHYDLKNAFSRIGDINTGSSEYKTLQVALKDLVKDVQVTKAFDIKVDEIKDTEMGMNVIKINKEFIAHKKQEIADKQLPLTAKIAKSLKLG